MWDLVQEWLKTVGPQPTVPMGKRPPVPQGAQSVDETGFIPQEEVAAIIEAVQSGALPMPQGGDKSMSDTERLHRIARMKTTSEPGRSNREFVGAPGFKMSNHKRGEERARKRNAKKQDEDEDN